MSWLTYSFIALFTFGLQKFLFKVSAEKNYSSKHVTLYFMGTVALVSMIFYLLFFRQDTIFEKTVILPASINGIVFLLLSLCRFKALKLLPSVIALPLFELSNVMLLPLSVVLFHDSLSLQQYTGISLGLISGYLLLKVHNTEHSQYPHYVKGIVFSIVAVIGALILGLLSKYIAVSSISKISFITVSYTINTVLMLIVLTIQRSQTKIKSSFSIKEVQLGVMIGLSNFIAFFFNLAALQTQALPIVGVIVSFSTIVALGLSIFFYKELLTKQRIFGIILAFVAVLLLK